MMILAEDGPSIGTVISIATTIVMAMGGVVVSLWKAEKTRQEYERKQWESDRLRLEKESEADKLRLREKMEQRDKEQLARIDTLQRLADAGAIIAKQLVDHQLKNKGLEPLPEVEALSAIRGSPATQQQVSEAKIYTTSAMVTAILVEAERAFPGVIKMPPAKSVTEIEDGATPNGAAEILADPKPKNTLPTDAPLGTLEAEGTLKTSEGDRTVEIKTVLEPVDPPAKPS